MRGVSVVGRNVVWASGTSGTVLRTIDGGKTWRSGSVPGASDLDFRDVQAFDERTAYILSSGPGEKSRIYKTNDGGAHWNLQFTNPDPKGFFDALAFWDAKNGLALGDPVAGEFVIFSTADGGAHWSRQHTPPALAGEGAFAASGTCLVVLGKKEAWFGTGGPGAARVFHSQERGRTWAVAAAPLRNDGPGAGIFSLAFSDALHGIAVGGDYNKPGESVRNIAMTADGGRTWTAPAGNPPAGFRSAVAYFSDRRIWIALGTSGSDVSRDGGKTWKHFDDAAYNAIGGSFSTNAWAVGPKGALARLAGVGERRHT